jgi:hypothetical protein
MEREDFNRIHKTDNQMELQKMVQMNNQMEHQKMVQVKVQMVKAKAKENKNHHLHGVKLWRHSTLNSVRITSIWDKHTNLSDNK